MVLQMELSKNPSLTSRLLMNKKILKIYTYIKIDYYNVLSDSQVGKTRVNKVREGLKTKKTHVQYKKNNKTGLDKLFLLQNDLLKEGLDMDEYVDYLTDKIDNKKYYYVGLNSDNIDALKETLWKIAKKGRNSL